MQMDKQGFREFLITRKLDEGQMLRYFAIVERFEQALGAHTPPLTLQTASAESTQEFVNTLIAEGASSEENLFALARYGRFCKNNALYVVVLELLDGGEAFAGMYRKVGDVVGEQVRDEIFDGIALPSLGVSNWEKSQLTRQVMQRIERLVDGETYRRIFSDSFRDLPDEYYLDDRKRYREIGDFDKFLEIKRQEFIAQLEQIKNEGSLFFSQEITDEVINFVRSDPEISQGVREGNTLYVTKIPYLTKQYLAESDPQKKRYYYCHCPWARESLRQAEGPVSAKFCQCSAGYHKKPWEVIFEQKIEADVLESVLKGDERCRFAIHLPI
jgi:hypothetical protein